MSLHNSKRIRRMRWVETLSLLNLLAVILLCFNIFYWKNALLSQDYSIAKVGNKTARSMFDGVWDKGRKCFFANFPKNFSADSSNLNSTWYSLMENVNKCYNHYYKKLDPMRVLTSDDVKYFVRPLTSPYPCNIVTLGIGHDITAESKFREIYPNCSFLGADPSPPDKNRELFEKNLQGTFVHAAVGSRGSQDNAKVLKFLDMKIYSGYEDIIVAYRNIIDFLNEYKPGEMIDLLLIDTEGSEYEILRSIADSGPTLPIICQMSLELHYHPAHVRLGVRLDHLFDTIRKLILGSRFALIHIEDSSINKGVGLFKALIINIENQQCINKYLKV